MAGKPDQRSGIDSLGRAILQPFGVESASGSMTTNSLAV